MRSMAQIQTIIARLLNAGLTITTYKVKSLRDGGGQTITIGRCRAAIPLSERQFMAVRYTKAVPSGETIYFPASVFAAHWFVEFVGRDRAKTVARQMIIENGLKPDMYGVKVTYDFETGRICW